MIATSGPARIRAASYASVWAVVILLSANFARTLPFSTPSGWDPAMMAIAPPLARWDSGWYRGIAVDGYSYDPGKDQNKVGFYPLYPMLMRIGWRVFHREPLVIGIAISSLSTIGASVLLADLAQLWFASEAADTAVMTLLLYPCSFLLVSVYTEALFLFCSILTIWAARKKFFLLAGLGAAATCLTRFNGFIILVPLVALCEGLDGGRRRFRDAAACLVPGALGAIAYPVYLWRRFGDPLLYIHDKERGWAQVHPGHFWNTFGAIAGDFSRLRLDPDRAGLMLYGLQLAGLLLLLGSTIVLARRRLLPEALYVGTSLLLMLSTGTLDGIQRYGIVMFPAMAVLGKTFLQRPILRFSYALAATCVNVLLMTRFIHWLYIG